MPLGIPDEGYKILLVDDDATLLELITLALSERGYRITAVTSGQQALKNLNRKAFHVVITDLFMPEIDGFAVLKKAKELDPNTIVIVMTGSTDLSLAARAKRAHADDYWLKPFSLSHLCNRVAQLLRESQDCSKRTLSELQAK